MQVNIVDNTFLRLSSDIDNIMDPHGQQENEEVNENLTEDIDDAEVKLLRQWKHTRPAIPDKIINENIKSLNMKRSF